MKPAISFVLTALLVFVLAGAEAEQMYSPHRNALNMRQVPGGSKKILNPSSIAGTSLLADDVLTVLDNPDVMNSYLLPPPNNLRCGLAAGTISTYSYPIKADSIALSDANGDNITLLNVSCTVNYNITGAGGFDGNGSVSPGFLYLHLIYDPTPPSAYAGLISNSASSPTLPSGYTYWRLIGLVVVNINSNIGFDWTIQTGNKWEATTAIQVGTFYQLTTTLQTSWTNLPNLPSIVNATWYKFYITYTAATAISNALISIDGGNSEYVGCSCLVNYSRGRLQAEVPIVPGTPIMYQTGSTGTLGIYLQGFILNL